MIKTILTLSLVACLTAIAPLSSHATTAIEIIDNDIQNVTITVSGNTVHINGANGQMVYVYNVTGSCIRKVKADNTHFELTLNQGCYIVKVGKTVRKISIS